MIFNTYTITAPCTKDVADRDQERDNQPLRESAVTASALTCPHCRGMDSTHCCGTCAQLPRAQGTTSAQKVTEFAEGSLGKDDVEPAMASLRAAFASEKTLSKEWRIGQLQALRTLSLWGCSSLVTPPLGDGYSTDSDLFTDDSDPESPPG